MLKQENRYYCNGCGKSLPENYRREDGAFSDYDYCRRCLDRKDYREILPALKRVIPQFKAMLIIGNSFTKSVKLVYSMFMASIYLHRPLSIKR
jgi:hypothetical protein